MEREKQLSILYQKTRSGNPFSSKATREQRLQKENGKDLDVVLKATPVLPEREARIIIVEIFQGLVYLNKRAQKIIHYDLKPMNVFFYGFGITKVTDFGLSKIVEGDVGSQGMELTSQGAGTYWQFLFSLPVKFCINNGVPRWRQTKYKYGAKRQDFLDHIMQRTAVKKLEANS
ncbi:hypothetical protein Peur_026475 [Populus x canadensis]